MTGRLCTGLGKTPEEVGSIGWPEVLEVLDYWRDCPPQHEVARIVAVRAGLMSPPEPEGPKRYATQDELAAMARAMEGVNG